MTACVGLWQSAGGGSARRERGTPDGAAGVRDTLAALRGLISMTIAGLRPALMRQTVDDRSTGKALGYL
jgi:hypothetical protein